MNLSDKLADSAVTRQIRLQRYSAGLRNRVISLLEDAATDIIAKLSGAKELTTFSKDRLTKQLSDIRQLIDKYYQDMASLTAVELQDLARIEAEWQIKTVNTAVGAEIMSAMPSEKVLGELAKDTLIMGAPSAEWWKRQSGDFQFRFVNEMRMGLAQGETNAQLVKRVRSVEDISKRNAEALVRTSAQTVAAEARRKTYQENDDVIKGVQQVSTLDSRTCFVAGTMVQMPFGQDVPIETIKAGDIVFGGSWMPRKVLATKSTKKTGLVKVTLSNGQSAICTADHMWLTSEGWKEAAFLYAGDKLEKRLK